VFVHAHLRVHVEVAADRHEELGERLLPAARTGERLGEVAVVDGGNGG
jgi:hypothetical protein